MSNHLADANKMVGDTPRTNARVKQMIDNDQGPEGLEYWARDLERELNAANDRIKRMEEENNELRAEEARLLNTNGELERRIKRLEEAGDRMEKLLPEGSICDRAVNAWREAKEAKP